MSIPYQIGNIALREHDPDRTPVAFTVTTIDFSTDAKIGCDAIIINFDAQGTPVASRMIPTNTQATEAFYYGYNVFLPALGKTVDVATPADS